MNALAALRFFANTIKWLILAGLLVSVGASAPPEETFAVLQVGARTYQNVTVTTHGKDYIFIHHSAGMNNIKVAELSTEVRDQLGYKEPSEAAKTSKTAAVSTWAKRALGNVQVSRLKQLSENLRGHGPAALATVNLNPSLLIPGLVVLVFSYFLFCYCSMLICQKTGNNPGVLVWVPILQLVPLLQAAGMSRGWLIVFLLPLVNIIAVIVWASNIVEARGKSGWVALFLILPITNFVAFLYLAFSSGTPRKAKDGRRMEIMSLELA